MAYCANSLLIAGGKDVTVAPSKLSQPGDLAVCAANTTRNGYLLVEVMVTLLLSSIIFGALVKGICYYAHDSPKILRKAEDQVKLETLELLLNRYASLARALALTEGIRAHSLSTPKNRFDQIAVKLLRGTSKPPRSQSEAVSFVELDESSICRRAFAEPSLWCCSFKGQNDSYLSFSYLGSVLVYGELMPAAGAHCDGGSLRKLRVIKDKELPLKSALSVFSDNSYDFSSQKLIFLVAIKDAFLIYLDKEGTLRYFSIVSGENQPLARNVSLFEAKDEGTVIKLRLQKGEESEQTVTEREFVLGKQGLRKVFLDFVL